MSADEVHDIGYLALASMPERCWADEPGDGGTCSTAMMRKFHADTPAVDADDGIMRAPRLFVISGAVVLGAVVENSGRNIRRLAKILIIATTARGSLPLQAHPGLAAAWRWHGRARLRRRTPVSRRPASPKPPARRQQASAWRTEMPPKSRYCEDAGTSRRAE